MVILNTCHIRDKAAEKVFSELGRLRRLKEARAAEGGRMILAVAGCVAQAEGAEILARAPYVDIVLGPQTYHRLPEMVARAARGRPARRTVIDTDFPAEQKFDFLPEAAAPQGMTAFLTIQEGCDKFCSFCVVPYTRGAEKSRPAAAVIAEARRLVAQGAREITLLGQNVNAWHGEAPDGGTWGLGRLMRELAELPGAAAAALHHLAPARHGRRTDRRASRPADADAVPAPAGAVGVRSRPGGDEPQAHRRRLSAPRRAAARGAARPRAVVGLHRRPSRRDRGGFRRDAGAGARRSASPRRSASSIRRGPAHRPPARPTRCRSAEKDRRLQELQALLRDQQARFNAGCVGLTLPVLFTGPGRHPGQIVGRSPFLQPVHVTGPADLIGTEIDGADRRRPPQFICPATLDRGESLRLSQTIAIPATSAPPAPAARP